jgi:hypothetical protein
VGANKIIIKGRDAASNVKTLQTSVTKPTMIVRIPSTTEYPTRLPRKQKPVIAIVKPQTDKNRRKTARVKCGGTIIPLSFIREARK